MKASIATKLFAVLTLTALIPMVVATVLSARVVDDFSVSISTDTREVARKSMRATAEREAEGLVTALAEQVKNPLVNYDFSALKVIVDTSSASPNVEGIRVIDSRGFVVADGTLGPISRKIEGAQFLRGTAGPEVEGDSLFLGRAVEVGGKTIGHVVVELGLAAERQAEQELRAAVEARRKQGVETLLRASLFAVLALGLLAVGISGLMGRRFARPIIALQNGTLRIAEGDWGARVEVRGRDELGQLASGFNLMAEELEGARAALQEQARISREMEIAERIQTSLVPQAPRHPDFLIAGRMEPAEEVGGDFYDVMTSASQGLWITIGDVSNHGLASGLIMLMAQSAFATACCSNSEEASPGLVLRTVNSSLYGNIRDRMGDNKYVTSLVLAYRGEGRFDYAGGHPWPLVFRRATGVVDEMPVDGAWLGLVRDVPEPPVKQLVLEPGDILCLYTDGVIEAMNESGEQYDLERLSQALASAAGAPTLDEGLVEMFADFDAFSDRVEDDRTVLLVMRRG